MQCSKVAQTIVFAVFGYRQICRAYLAPAGARVTSLYVLAVANLVKRMVRLPPTQSLFCRTEK